MKKLMVLFAAIAMMGAAQAAWFKWYAWDIYDSSGTQYYNGTAVIKAYWGDITAASAVEVATATVGDGGFTSDVVAVPGEDASVLYTFYVVITDGDKVFDSSKAGVTASSYPNDEPGVPRKVYFGSLADATQNSANWTAVPEPTSGLLLLVGGALLALRRRRA